MYPTRRNVGKRAHHHHRRESPRGQIAATSTTSTVAMPSISQQVATAKSTPIRNAPTLHLRMRANRSKSESHKRSLRSRSTSPSATSTSTIPAGKIPPVPQRRPPLAPSSSHHAKKRSTSPDVADIISATARPRTRTSSLYSNGSDRNSQQSLSLSRPSSMRRLCE